MRTNAKPPIAARTVAMLAHADDTPDTIGPTRHARTTVGMAEIVAPVGDQMANLVANEGHLRGATCRDARPRART